MDVFVQFIEGDTPIPVQVGLSCLQPVYQDAGENRTRTLSLNVVHEGWGRRLTTWIGAALMLLLVAVALPLSRRERWQRLFRRWWPLVLATAGAVGAALTPVPRASALAIFLGLGLLVVVRLRQWTRAAA